MGKPASPMKKIETIDTEKRSIEKMPNEIGINNTNDTMINEEDKLGDTLRVNETKDTVDQRSMTPIRNID